MNDNASKTRISMDMKKDDGIRKLHEKWGSVQKNPMEMHFWIVVGTWLNYVFEICIQCFWLKVHLIWISTSGNEYFYIRSAFSIDSFDACSCITLYNVTAQHQWSKQFKTMHLIDVCVVYAYVHLIVIQ